MKISILDPTGNITALVEESVLPEEQPAAAAELMARYPAVEQVGFVRLAAGADGTSARRRNGRCGSGAGNWARTVWV